MKKALILTVVIGLAVSAGAADNFYANRDAGINNGNAYDNQGACSDVRTAKWGCDESFIMDFDTAAILSLMGGNPISDYTFTLFIMPSSGWPASAVSVDVQTINTNDDWAEGNDPNRFNSFGWTEGTPAVTSEYAQTYWVDVGGTPTLDTGNCVTWKREDGTPESRFKYLPANYTNSASLTGSSADHGSHISVVLDESLVNDLLNNAKNRGLRLYRNAGDNLQNYTREAAANQRPYLQVVYAGGPGPQIAFAGPATDGSESATPGELRVELSEKSSQTVTVNYAVTGGTAQGGGVDYTLAAGTLTFTPGQIWNFIDISVVDDGDLEGDETIVVTLSNPVGGTLGAQITHTYTILDNDRTGQTWNCSTVAQMENALQNCQPNDEIVLAAGTYVLQAIPTINTHHVILRGATGDPDDVVLTGPGMNVDANPREAMVVNHDNFTIMDLTIKEVYHNGIHIRGEYDVDRMWIRNVKTFNIGERHIKGSRNFSDRASNSEDCIIELAVMEADKVPSGHPDNNYVGGIDVMAMKNLILRDCVAINIKGATGGARGGIFLWQENYNVTVERNKIYGGDTGICLGNPSYPDAPDHWAVDGGILRNNFVTRGTYIALELCFTRDIKVYHNSIYSNDANYFRTVHVYGNNTTNLQSKYNIIRGQVFENGASWTDVGSIIGTAPQANWFTDWTVADLHLTASATPAIDTASPLAEVPEDFDEQPRGSLPDKGGDESNPPGELPTVTLSATDPNAAEEGQDTGTFTFTRDQTSGNLVVNYSIGGTAEPGDYEETLTGSVTIPDGQPSTTITITPVDDSEVEGSETVILTLTADPAYQIGSPSSGTVTIADNDVALPVVTLSATDPNAAEEGQDTGTFTFTRDQTSGNLVVNYSIGGTAEPGDYEETLTGSVTIPDGQPSTTIDITPVDDSEVEGDETAILTLTADPAYQIGSPSSGTVTIADNDTAGPEELFFDGFESGNFTAGGWTVSGSASVSGRAAYNGDYGARLARVSSITKALSTAGYTDIHVKCYWRTRGLDSGEYLYCEWSDNGGQNWYELGKTRATSWAQVDFTCPAGAANNPNFQVRFRTNASRSNEYGDVDDVEIVGTEQ